MCDACGRSVPVPYESLTKYKGDLLCTDCLNVNRYYDDINADYKIKKCSICGSTFETRDNTNTCTECASTAICANCGDIVNRSNITQQGYCENCSSRMNIDVCVISHCNRSSTNTQGICHYHSYEYILCPICNITPIKKDTDIICEGCIKAEDLYD